VEVWINGEKKLTYNGPTCLANDNPLNFTSEVYSFFNVASPSDAKRIVYQDCIRIGDENSSFDEVSPVGTIPDILFSDDFEDGDANGWTTSGGSWSVVTDDTKMFRQSSASNTAQAWAGSDGWDNYTYEVRIKPLNFGTNASFGICARYADIQNNYSFIYSKNTGTIRIQKKVNGNITILAEKSYAISTGNTYTFKAVLNGNVLEFYVNGTKQLTAVDSTFTSGKIALTTYYASAAFDDITVQSD